MTQQEHDNILIEQLAEFVASNYPSALLNKTRFKAAIIDGFDKAVKNKGVVIPSVDEVSIDTTAGTLIAGIGMGPYGPTAQITQQGAESSPREKLFYAEVCSNKPYGNFDRVEKRWNERTIECYTYEDPTEKTWTHKYSMNADAIDSIYIDEGEER